MYDFEIILDLTVSEKDYNLSRFQSGRQRKARETEGVSLVKLVWQQDAIIVKDLDVEELVKKITVYSKIYIAYDKAWDQEKINKLAFFIQAHFPELKNNNKSAIKISFLDVSEDACSSPGRESKAYLLYKSLQRFKINARVYDRFAVSKINLKGEKEKHKLKQSFFYARNRDCFIFDYEPDTLLNYINITLKEKLLRFFTQAADHEKLKLSDLHRNIKKIYYDAASSEKFFLKLKEKHDFFPREGALPHQPALMEPVVLNDAEVEWYNFLQEGCPVDVAELFVTHTEKIVSRSGNSLLKLNEHPVFLKPIKTEITEEIQRAKRSSYGLFDDKDYKKMSDIQTLLEKIIQEVNSFER